MADDGPVEVEDPDHRERLKSQNGPCVERERTRDVLTSQADVFQRRPQAVRGPRLVSHCQHCVGGRVLGIPGQCRVAERDALLKAVLRALFPVVHGHRVEDGGIAGLRAGRCRRWGGLWARGLTRAPRIQFAWVRVDAREIGVVVTTYGECLVPLPPLDGADRPSEVAGDLFPPFQMGARDRAVPGLGVWLGHRTRDCIQNGLVPSRRVADGDNRTMSHYVAPFGYDRRASLAAAHDHRRERQGGFDRA